MSQPPWHICVLIPARNEEALLPRCLESVLVAQDYLPRPVTSDVIVVADCSTDRTTRIAAELIGTRGVVIQTDVGSAGGTRKLCAAAALARYTGPAHRCWLANTDADCIIPPDWLVRFLDFAESGVEAVAGVVSIDTFAEHGPELPERFRTSYLIQPDGSHSHVHGANLGLRADAYLRSGGWSELETAEDHDLWRRLSWLGKARLASAKLTVVTSGRRVGRAPCGFAATLAAHNEAR